MSPPNRFEIVAPLPSPTKHLHLAVDRGTTPPRAVVLALYQRALSDDPGRLGRLAGEMERAAQLFHPNVLAPVGIEEVGEDLAALTVWRDAITLRELIDAGGAIPHEIAVRIAVDVCAGLAHAHGRSEPVVHGLVRPEAVLLDENGVAMLSGFGMPGGSGVADDILGVGELLHELLAGEPPDDPSVPMAEGEAPPPLVAVVNQARSPVPEARHPTAETLGMAMAQAVPPAAHETVAAYVNAILPGKSGLRAERREKIAAALAAPAFAPQEISDDDIFADAFPAEEPSESDVSHAPAAKGNAAGAAGPVVPSPSEASPTGSASALGDSPSSGPSPAADETAAASPPADETTINTKLPPAAEEPPETTIRVKLSSPEAKPAGKARVNGRTTPLSTRTPTSTASTVPPSPRASPPEEPGEREEASAIPPAHEERSAARGRRVSLATALLMLLVGVAGGFALAALTPWRELAGESLRHAAEKLAPARPAAPAAVPEEARAPEPPSPADPGATDTESSGEPSEAAATPPPAPVRRPPVREKKKRVRETAAPASAAETGTGFIVVTAPENTEILLDGQLIGKGDTRKQIPVGKHRVDVRRGRAKVGESFRLEAGETWTYAVTSK